jgi:hypothetical protein
MRHVLISTLTPAALALVAIFGLSGCHRPSSTDNEAPDTSSYRPEATPATEFERDLKFIREGHFKHVWLFSRLDGKAFTSDDGEFLRTTIPKVVDWVGTDEKRKYLAGSNFDLDPAQLAALQKRFKVEDYTGK